MTKIKNTKKGMAKKTLSVSLAVAMLATSNVPVLAAEFSDGAEAAFTSEAEAISVVKPEGEGAAERVSVTGGTFSSDVSDYAAGTTPVAFKFNEDGYYVGEETIQNVASSLSADDQLKIMEGTVRLTDVPAGVTVIPKEGTTVVVNGKDISGSQYLDGYTVPQSSGYYYYHPTTDTKATDTKGSPKTFDAGIALYVGMALTSVAGAAFAVKKRED